MQKPISDKIQMGKTLNPARSYGGVPSINDEGTLENLISKADKVTGFVATGRADGDLSRYYSNILSITIELTANTYSNYSTMEVYVPIKFTKKTNKALQMDANMVTVNNVFGNWFTDIDIRRYPDMMILPINNSVDIYQYSNAQMKYLPEKSVKKLLKTMLYSNNPVYLAKNTDRRPHNDNDDDKRSDPNLTYRLAQLKNHLF